MRRIPALAFLALPLLGMLTSPRPAWGQTISLAEVVRQVIRHHPDLRVAHIETEQARTEQQNTEGQLDPTYNLNLLASEDQTPSNFTFNPTLSSRFLQVKGGITQPLDNGASVTVSADYNRTLQTFAKGPGSFTRFDPFYHNQIDISYRHPLLRGAGRPQYHQQLAAALADASAAEQQELVAARALSRKAIQLYFDIAADEANRKLAADAATRAKKLLRYQKMREQFGLIEKADRLQAEALLATRNMDLARAEAALVRDVTALNRLMLRDAHASLATDDSQRLDAPLPDIEDAMQDVSARRPELQALDARMQAAEARLKQAEDTGNAQLDIVGQVGSRSLAGSPGIAARQGFSVADRFASIGVEISDTITNNAARAAIRKAALEREKVRAERSQTIELIKDDLSNILALLETGRKTWRAALARVAAEKKKYTAELQRYRAGRSDTATVIQFEGDLRTAEIEAALRRIALLRNQRQLAWIRGTLFSELGVSLPGAPQ